MRQHHERELRREFEHKEKVGFSGNRRGSSACHKRSACRLSPVAGTCCGSSGSSAKSSGTFGGSSGLLPSSSGLLPSSSGFWADVEGPAAYAAASSASLSTLRRCPGSLECRHVRRRCVMVREVRQDVRLVSRAIESVGGGGTWAAARAAHQRCPWQHTGLFHATLRHVFAIQTCDRVRTANKCRRGSVLLERMRGELTNEGSRGILILAIAPSQTSRKTDTAAKEPSSSRIQLKRNRDTGKTHVDTWQ